MPKQLTDAEVEEFVERGFVRLAGGFPKDVATELRDLVWEYTGAEEDDPSGWPTGRVHIQEIFTGEPWTKAYTPRVEGAYDDLLGEGRWVPRRWLGMWPVLFPGAAEPPWVPPARGWHIDGHALPGLRTLAFPERALITLFLFSDVPQGSGGTAIDVGSHKTTARVIRDGGPEGLPVTDIIVRGNQVRPRNEVEATGEAGDVLLMHPLLLHAISENTGSTVRFACNPFVGLKEPMRFDRDPADLSPVERAIVDAVSVRAIP